MSFDLRYPVGLMFTLFGALIGGFGLLSDAKMYDRSLGININLWWGCVLLVFGVIMLTLAISGKKNTK
jgi:hypothetical protein